MYFEAPEAWVSIEITDSDIAASPHEPLEMAFKKARQAIHASDLEEYGAIFPEPVSLFDGKKWPDLGCRSFRFVRGRVRRTELD